ncbi:hypothetical protein ACLSU7_13720 [Bdellovibrio sp. HCB185ZH]|uniref:hypothetical protein n=1 Tax=Bdellovibrio sp. HCB185ZH TaxID=3394235 RepID=UPI0039A4B596
MKHLVLASLFILGASTSHAVVADHFTCTATISNKTAEVKAVQSQDFSVVRLPSSDGTTKPYNETTGRTSFKMDLQTSVGRATANLNLYYKHASRPISGSTGLEARQFTCMGVAVGYCAKPQPGQTTSCMDDVGVACMERFNPFDPVDGWSKTRVDGTTPVFTDTEISPASAEISDEQTGEKLDITVNCKFLGTYK